MGSTLVDDFCRSTTLRAKALGVAVFYMLGSWFVAHRVYLRKEISRNQAIVLSLPFLGVWILLITARAIAYSILGKPN